MYLGGMGGTGKSTVIKALVKFFQARNEAHRFIIVAPTGAAAALLNGSTYHSVFGINDRNDDNTGSQIKQVAQIRSSLEGVEYVFLDEVSMLGCRSMYGISAAAAKALSVPEEAFGGLNMIFAGDFAQLAPVKAQALYSGFVGTKVNSAMTVKDQEEAIGKALWHQTTTVVILRENMRQRSQSADDSRLRTALENMRYKSCTDADVAYLRSRIAGRGPNKPKLAQKRFRNVSVITARNIQKDHINSMGAQRYAVENDKELTTFYSNDAFKTQDVDLTSKQGRSSSKRVKDAKRSSKNIPLEKQHDIWDILPSLSDHVPGKLTLCPGMPVMIRYNEATECCITKGAEATVVGWDSTNEAHGLPMLDTLFVLLKNPPNCVKIEGLPENVVPISRRQEDVVCTLNNGEKLSISRSQVPILINFAMTDYSSQGRTRPDNPVDLQNCRTHMSYYTALSRSATSEGTIIVQGFDASHIQGGASGYLRQEFRELELLDEITKQRFEGALPADFVAETRNVLIRRFRELKGEAYLPPAIHESIAWSSNNPYRIKASSATSQWQFSAKGKHVAKTRVSKKAHVTAVFVPAAGSVPGNSIGSSTLKRKKGQNEQECDANKRQRTNVDAGERSSGVCPVGFGWDEENWSCCYDSLLSILLNIWMDKPALWTTAYRALSPEMKILSTSFRDFKNDDIDVETARDRLRRAVNAKDPDSFPYGELGSKIHVLTDTLASAHARIQLSVSYCRECGKEDSMESAARYCVDCPDNSLQSTQAFLDRHMLRQSDTDCEGCRVPCYSEIRYRDTADLVFFNIRAGGLPISKLVRIQGKARARILDLRGVIYSDGDHYTARVIDCDELVWFSDGMVSNGQCSFDDKLTDLSEMDLNERSGSFTFGISS
ncbi:hypothetical protein HWV62_2599 [Athelia sp. TMB]|nr:hypothetical protein HWV62_2599 [Athelia sp. TMB]